MIYFIPATFVKECTGAASCHSTILNRYLIQIKLICYHAAPSPHTVFIVIFIFNRTVADGKQYRASFFAARTGSLILFNRFQILCQFQPFAGAYSVSGRFGIHFGTESAGMNAVDIEHIFHFILAEFLKLAGADIIQINERNILFFRYLLCPQTECFVDTGNDGAVLVCPCIAGSQGE